MSVIHYEDWRLWADPGLAIARQYDNLTRRLEITGDLPEGWDWTLLVEADREHLDLIALRPMEGGLGVDLTAEMLALSGYYTIQLRGNQGELVRHTNQVRIFIPSSLSGDANWPELPSEFSQAEADIRALNAHPPIPGDGGYWLVWDLDGEKYVTSNLPLPDVSVGPPGQAATITVGETVTGEPGTQAAVENTGTENAAVLRFTIPRGAAGPTGATPDISVEVTGLPAGSEPTAEVSGTPEQPVIALGIPAGRQGEPGGKGDPGTPGKDGSPGQTPNITVGQVETLPAGSPVTASITGQTPNLVLNLGIPQGEPGPAGAGVPPTDGVPEDYLLSVGGWAPPPDGGGTGGGNTWTLLAEETTEEPVSEYKIDLGKQCTELIIYVEGAKLSDDSENGEAMFYANNASSLNATIKKNAGSNIYIELKKTPGFTNMTYINHNAYPLATSASGFANSIRAGSGDVFNKFVFSIGYPTVNRFSAGMKITVFGR